MSVEGPLTFDRLYGRFFHRADAVEARALFIDSGRESGRFVLTAWPTESVCLSVSGLEQGELLHWIREHLPSERGDGSLHALVLAYDAGRNLEHLRSEAPTDPVLPDAVWARYDAWLESDSADGPYRFAGSPVATTALKVWLDAAQGGPLPTCAPPSFRSAMDQRHYKDVILDVLRRIVNGELYQANIARRLEAPFNSQELPALYRRLREHNPAEFGALWAVESGSWLASNSPECLFTYDPQTRWVHSYPIKGTRPRGASSSDDAEVIDALARDPKERAEHLMIVDLVRNDLGRVCETGSVGVDDLFGVHPLPTLHHMVSDIRGKLSAELDLADLIGALFPGGSITGAPKVAAMNCIDALEQHRRGYYCGSLVIVEPNGQAAANILIRTLVATGGTLYYQTGGGIVADSSPECEWRETEIKARALTSL